MKTVYQGIYFGLTALLLCPAISLAAEVDYGGHLKYFFSYSDFPDKSVFSGDDNHYIEHLGDLQALVIPRRDVTSGDLESQSSSAAAKMHWLKDQDEVDLLAGFNLPAGPDGSEFGGLSQSVFTNAADGRILGLSNALFARLAWYF